MPNPSVIIKFRCFLIASLIMFPLIACEKVDVDLYENYPNMPARMKVAQWNVFMFGIKDGVFGVSDENAEETVTALNDLIDGLDADVLFLNEYNGTIDQSKRYDTYETLLFKRYPYFFKGGFYSAVASKYPLKMEEVQLTHRKFIVGELLFRESKVAIACIHPDPGTSDETTMARIEDHQQVVNRLREYERVIVAGDFNTITTNELDIYRTGGYTLGNNGSFGAFITYPSTSRALDNIVVKGMKLEHYAVVNEQVMSDHYPSVAELIL